MSKYKDLKARVEQLEEQMSEQSYDVKRVECGYPYGPYIYSETHPTIRAQVDAILSHLGLGVDWEDKKVSPAHIKVTVSQKKGKK